MSPFAHLRRLSLNQSAIERVIVLLDKAGRFRDADPQVATYLCRAALEELCRAVEAERRPRDTGTGFPGQRERFDWLIDECKRKGNFDEGRIWKQFRKRNGEWNSVTHSEKDVTTNRVINHLRFWHMTSWELCCIQDPTMPGVTPDYVPPRGIQEELEAYHLERDRLKQVELEKAESERIVRESARKAEQELAAARCENEALRKRQESSPLSAQIQELLRESERRVAELAEKGRALFGEVERCQRERNEAVGRAEGVEAQVRQLRDEIACEAEARQQLEQAEARRRRYEDEYPGVEQAHEFFQSAIDGDEEGALPPLSSLGNFVDLGFDRYARRLEASHASGLCTLRVISLRPGVGDFERRRGWEVEAWNLSRMEELRDRLGIARLVESAVKDRPGFSLFSRVNSPLLSSFGAACQTLRLATALRFSIALADDLAARARVRMSVSWPDLHAVGVHQGTPRLLEPTAPHFGDLGPPEDLEKTADQCVALSRDELEAGWAFVVAHAMLRLSGVLPSRRLSEASIGSLDRRWLRTHLEELRRACDEQISRTALDELAVSLVGVMQERGPKQPCLEELLKAMRNPLAVS